MDGRGILLGIVKKWLHWAFSFPCSQSDKEIHSFFSTRVASLAFANCVPFVGTDDEPKRWLSFVAGQPLERVVALVRTITSFSDMVVCRESMAGENIPGLCRSW